MSADKTTALWHLTSDGWVPGDFRFYSSLVWVGDPRVPPTRVETLRREMVQTHAMQPEQIGWHLDWSDPGTPEEDRASLHRRHGTQPDHDRHPYGRSVLSMRPGSREPRSSAGSRTSSSRPLPSPPPFSATREHTSLSVDELVCRAPSPIAALRALAVSPK